MKRVASLFLLGCFLGCGDSQKAGETAFDANDFDQTFLWIQSIYNPVREAEEQANELLVTEAASKAAKNLKKIEGTAIQWTFNVESLRRATAEDPEFAELAEGGKPTGFVVTLEAPEIQMNDEENTLHLFFSRSKTAQDEHAYRVYLDEKDREYALTLTKGTPVQVSATLRSIEAVDETGTGFILKLTEAQLVR